MKTGLSIPDLTVEIVYQEVPVYDVATFLCRIVRTRNGEKETVRFSSGQLFPPGDGELGQKANRLAHATVLANDIAIHLVRELMGEDSYKE